MLRGCYSCCNSFTLGIEATGAWEVDGLVASSLRVRVRVCVCILIIGINTVVYLFSNYFSATYP